jgi:hypothetical protein
VLTRGVSLKGETLAGDPATDITALRDGHVVIQACDVVARDGQVLD